MPFRVTPDNPQTVRDALEVSKLMGRGYCYLSTPITGGARWLNWDGDPKTKKSQVIDPNIAAARRLIARLPSQKVIDPTLLDIPGWTQNDYRYFFGELLKSHAVSVVMADGWELSIGCIYEYLCAHEMRLQILDSKLLDIPPEKAWILVANGVKTMERLGKENIELKELLAELGALK